MNSEIMSGRKKRDRRCPL